MSSKVSSSGNPIFFWMPKEHPYGFLSQWYPSPFTAPSPVSGAAEMSFLSTEQYMMYHKAVLFQDPETAEKIMIATKPAEQKALGRQVKNFDNGKWLENRDRIVEEGNWNKFTNTKAGPELRDLLLGTGKRELVETSPYDRIWGVGYAAKNAEANRSNWGLNLLGKAIMRVRERLQADTEHL